VGLIIVLLRVLCFSLFPSARDACVCVFSREENRFYPGGQRMKMHSTRAYFISAPDSVSFFDRRTNLACFSSLSLSLSLSCDVSLACAELAPSTKSLAFR
jgi:hypothetical protein